MTPDDNTERDQQDEAEAETRLRLHELFGDAGDAAETDPPDIRPGNPAPTLVDDPRALARQLFNPA